MTFVLDPAAQPDYNLPMTTATLALLAAQLLAASAVEKPASDPAAPPVLQVRVQGIKGAKGEIGIAVFNSPTGYPIHIEHAYENEWIPVKEGVDAVEAEFDSLPPGQYAVSVLHDENGNRKLERTAVGFPKEGVGFSNDQKVTLKAPGYKKSKFELGAGQTKKIVITLDYRK